MVDETDTSAEETKPAKKQRSEYAPPEGFSLISEADFNRTQAELRKLKSQQAAADAEAKRIAAEASGQYQQALAVAEERRIKAEAAANRLAVQDALRNEILRRGLTGEKAAAAIRLADTSGITAEDGAVTDPNAARNAVESVFINFKGLFSGSVEESAQGEGTKPAAAEGKATMEETKKTPGAGPGTPANAERMPTGYLSPEEYMATPLSERMTPEFQKRVALSESKWPSEVPATSFSQDS